MPHPKPHPIKVYVEGDAIVFYRDKNKKLFHSSDLSLLRTHMLIDLVPISDLYKQYGRLDGFIRAKQMTHDIANTEDAAQKYIAALQKIYPKNPGTEIIAEIARNRFYETYDMLPPCIKAMVEFSCAPVVIARGNSTESLGGGKRTSAFAGQVMGFSEVSSQKYMTVLEEFAHKADTYAGNPDPDGDFTEYTESKAWQKAVELDLVPPGALVKLLFHNALPRKDNTFVRLPKDDPNRFAEALTDVICVEHYLSEMMRKNGNLTEIGAGIKPNHTIDDVMNAAMPGVWKLYRGPAHDSKLVQDTQGKITEIKADAEIPAGCIRAISFIEQCNEEILGSQKVTPTELPLPHSKKKWEAKVTAPKSPEYMIYSALNCMS